VKRDDAEFRFPCEGETAAIGEDQNGKGIDEHSLSQSSRIQEMLKRTATCTARTIAKACGRRSRRMA
jgi:hypothetical protein